MISKQGWLFVLGALLVTGVWLSVPREPVQGQARGGAGRHTVVSTDGAHLIVTDNSSDKLYFYAIDKDGKVGDELKLRGTLDLSEVGKPTIKPTDAKPQK